MAAVSRTQSLRRGGPLPRLWIDSSLSSYRKALYSPTSALSSARISDATTVLDTPFSPDPFHVLCIYDFEADDPGQLSFRKNEVLDVVKREETGWWAAVRPGEDQPGWIPSAFVEPISEAVARKLRASSEEPRIHDDANRSIRSPAGLPRGSHTYVASPDGDVGYSWLPLMDGDQAPIIKLFKGSDAKEAASIFSPLVPPDEGVDGVHLDPEFDISPIINDTSKLNIRTTSEVVQPTPVKDKHAAKPRASPHAERHSTPLHYQHEPPSTSSEHARSHSDPSSTAVSRHLRRRPVLIDDRSSLSRLSTLFETKSVEELDSLLCSPAIAEELDVLSPSSRVFVHSPDSYSPIAEQKEGPVPGDVRLPVTPSSLSPTVDQDELQLRADGSVAAGSLRGLLDRLTDDDVGVTQQHRFQRIFLMTFKTFTSSDEVFISLLSRFYMSQRAVIPGMKSGPAREETVESTQRQILEVFKLWYEEYGMFRDDPHIVRRLVNFLSSINSSSAFAVFARAMLEHIERSARVQAPTPAPAPGKRKKRKASKSDFVRMDPGLIAQYLCLHEHRLYTKIRPQECLHWVRHGATDSVVNLAAFRATRDRLAAWVKTSIVSADAFVRRADTFNFWIRVAETCKTLSNFSSMSAVAAGLSDPAIAGQQLLWAQVPRGTHLDVLTLLDVPSDNYHAYGALQQSVDGPCVPFIEMYLADLAHIDHQLPDNVALPGGTASLVNFTKREKWYDAVEAIVRYQAYSYSFAEDPSIADFVETNLASVSEGELSLSATRNQDAQRI